MSPAATAGTGAAVPTRSEVESWDTRDLDDAATRWRDAAEAGETAFETHRQNIMSPGGTSWEGDAKDTALDRVTADLAVARHHGDVQRESAEVAAQGAQDIVGARNRVLDAIAEADGDDFTVGDDLSVTDNRAYDAETAAARVTAAIEHGEYIAWRAEQLAATDALVGQQLTDKAAELEGIRFEGEGDGRDPAIQLVDNETEKPEQPAETASDDPGSETAEEKPNPKDPHATDPNRSADGTYGPENSGDGKAAEKAALDERERVTGVEVIRDQVRATHPDVTDSETGKPRHRYFDGLEPTDVPGEYIGLEAKTDEGTYVPPEQVAFEKAISRENPATAVVDGKEVKIVGTERIYPPEGWEPPSAQASGQESQPAGGAESGSAGPAVPPALAGGAPEGTVPAASAPTQAPVAGSPIPDWGTQLTPQQMIDSDDPALRVAGQEIRRRMAEQGIVDPSGIA